MNKKYNIRKALLIIKDDKEAASLVRAIGRIAPKAEIMRDSTVQQGIRTAVREKPDILFTEFKPSRKDRNIISAVRTKNVYVPVVAIVERGREIQAAESIKQGAFDYLLKNGKYSAPLMKIMERLHLASGANEEEKLGQHSALFRQIYRSQKWWQNIIDAITDYLFVIGRDHKILRTNKAFAGLFGKEPADIIMTPYYELFGLDAPHEWCVFPEGRKDVLPRSVEKKINGVDYLISSFPIHFDANEAMVYIMKDITETRRLKDQIYHLDKLSSLGTLTSGVAHEINNPLTGIIGYTEMLLMRDGDETTKKYLKNIYDSAIRCKKIVENMLTFSRQTPAKKGPENINDIIDKTVELHEYWLKSSSIEIVKDYEDAHFVSVDRQQMQQVFLNLLINAEQAIAESGRKGKIEFKTRYDDRSKRIIITVSDNGVGIPQQILPKIFDPFFTTKPVNMGTGLGLSITHGIIAEQSGTIEAVSTPGQGTSFTIKLPGS